MNVTGTRSIDDVASSDDEHELLERLRRGEESAYAEIVRRYGPRLLIVAGRFLQHDQDAQDAVQDAFLSAFRNIGGFSGQARLSTWLHRITVNAALMKLRSRRRKPEKNIEDLLPRFRDDGHMVDPVSDWAVTLDTAVADREIREVVRSSIDQLPETYRTVLLMRDIEGLNTDETAAALEISNSAVKTRLHRARLALRTLLDPYMRGAKA